MYVNKHDALKQKISISEVCVLLLSFARSQHEMEVH